MGATLVVLVSPSDSDVESESRSDSSLITLGSSSFYNKTKVVTAIDSYLSLELTKRPRHLAGLQHAQSTLLIG